MTVCLGALREQRLGRLAVQHRDGAAGLQPRLPADNDLLVRLQAGIDDGVAGADLRHLDCAVLDRPVGLDHVHVAALRPLPARRARPPSARFAGYRSAGGYW